MQRFICRSEAIDADYDLSTGVDACLGPCRGLLDPPLGDSGLDRLGHAAEPVDLSDMLERLGR